MTQPLFCTRWNAEAAEAVRRRNTLNVPWSDAEKKDLLEGRVGYLVPAPRPRNAWVEPFLYGTATGFAGSNLLFLIMFIWRAFA